MISDLVTEGELSENIRRSFDAWADCLGGALEKNEYLRIIKKAGFRNVKMVSETPFTIEVSRKLLGKIFSVKVEGYK